MQKSLVCHWRWPDGPGLCLCLAAVCSWATSQASLSACDVGIIIPTDKLVGALQTIKQVKCLIQCPTDSVPLMFPAIIIINVINVIIIHKYL